MVDMIEFTRRKTGMNDEYIKILEQEIWIINANGHEDKALKDRYEELRKRKERYLQNIQHMMLELTLQERALAEIKENWNNKKYWGIYF